MDKKGFVINGTPIYIELIMVAIVLILIFGVGWIILDSQRDYFDNCNDLYGENNWYLNEPTGKDKCKTTFGMTFIGQCYECISMINDTIIINNTINVTVIKEVEIIKEIEKECPETKCNYTRAYVLSLIRQAKHCERKTNLSDCYYKLEEEIRDHNKTKAELHNKTEELCRLSINSSCYD